MSTHCAIYSGAVMHRRIAPRPHRFRYRVFWLFLDLDELPALAGRLRLFSHNSANLFSLNDADHGDGSATPLRQQVERQLTAAAIDISGGAIRLFCMPRTLGYEFNPLSIYFCHRADGALAAVIYEVHNTFGERHSYLIPAETKERVLHQHCRKTFFVSPFMNMEMSYAFRVHLPGERVAVAIQGSADDRPLIYACLTAKREDLTDRALLRAGIGVPFATAKVIAAIHWEALRLWLKGLRIRPRPAPPDRLVTIIPAHARKTD
jgi:DUF1365 family protein